MPDERFQPGQSIAQYKLERKIDVGGMGEVWRARKPDSALVAIKFPHRQFANDPNFPEMARREAAAQIILQHPNIVAVEDLIEIDGLPAIVFYFVDGPNLETEIYGAGKLIEQGRPLAIGRALKISSQILNALDFAHQCHYVHRDVKSSNILIEAGTDRAFLTDFGLVLNTAGQRMTRLGTISGSVPYMSPEQITNPSSVNAQSDVYSFGIALYEMLTGVLPFRIESGETTDPDFLIKEKHLKREPTPPSALNPRVSPELDAIVLKALQKVPGQRFSGCREFERSIADLETERERPVPQRVVRPELLPVALPPAHAPAISAAYFTRERINAWLPWIFVGVSVLIVLLALLVKSTRS